MQETISQVCETSAILLSDANYLEADNEKLKEVLKDEREHFRLKLEAQEREEKIKITTL